MKAIDLFCGSGGLTLGLRNVGWEVVAGIDIDDAVEATYVRNNPDSKFIAADLRSVTDEAIREVTGVSENERLLLAGCAPCQPFSKQLGQRGPRNRGDATLLGQFARFVRALKPEVILMENVPGVEAVSGYSTLKRFLKTLCDLGYDCDHRVLNARDFGVPQHRRRFVLIAGRESEARLPSPTHDSDNHATVRTTIERFPAIDSGESDPDIPNHCAARLSERNLRRIRATPVDGGSRRDWPEDLTLECHRSVSGFSDVYGRMWWDRVAPTLTSRCNSLSNGRFGHPEQDRAISLREAAALQTFPDDFVFVGSKNPIARWIGNAVPVRFAEALGRSAMKTIT